MRIRNLFLCALVIAWSAAAPAAWHEAKSKHFIIYADQAPKRLKTFAERLERFDQAVRLVRNMDDPPLTNSRRLKVYMVGNESQVSRLAGIGRAAGFYVARASGAAAFVPGTAGDDDNELSLQSEAIFFHEYAHHMQLQSASIALPGWAIEGFAEFFATSKIQDNGDVSIGSPPLYRGYSLLYGSLSFERFFSGEYAKLSDQQIDLVYGRGWLLIHYLTFEPSRKGQLGRFEQEIVKGSLPLDAAKEAFGDLKVLGRELERYKMGTFKAIRVKADRLSVGNIDVRQLTAPEAAVMNVHVRSTAGVDQRTAQTVVKAARKAAAPYPSNGFAQRVLAEAEFDSGNYEAAEAAADRALAANPNDVHALIYKGRAMTEMARTQPTKADWKQIRSWFLKANRLATENAQPLMLYYDTFVHEGAQPTKNARSGLNYAVVLAPQDDNLRIKAVRQRLADQEMAEAKKLFAPLAFAPHASEEGREKIQNIKDAIERGDAKTALDLIDSNNPEGDQNS